MSIEENGIRECNSVESALEPLINVQELKDRWLFGIVPIVAEDGSVVSDETLAAYIKTAVSMLEHDLDISVIPRRVIEKKDYRQNDYYEWGYFHLDNIPVIDDPKVSVVYLLNPSNPNDDNSPLVPETVLEIPKNWIRIKKDSGELRLIPNNRFPANLQIDSAGAFFPELFNRHSMVPDLWHIEYSYGFKDGKIPAIMNAAIGLMASIMAMNIAGDLRIGSGIASISLNLDGLSQSINSTASAENHTYSAKVKEYGKLLFGEPGLDGRNQGIVQNLRNFYRGSTLNII